MKIWDTIKIGLSFILGWIVRQWVDLGRKVEERRRETEAVLEAQKKQFERERAHENRMVQIHDNRISGDDVSRMLSSYPSENSETRKTRD